MLTPTFFARSKALVVGGGSVAERKVKGLLAVGASVTIISPLLTSHLQELANTGAVEWLARAWQTDDIASFPAALLVFTATDNPAVNELVAQAARHAGRLVNRADAPLDCDFVLPGVVRSGEITLTIATFNNTSNNAAGESGASPALTTFLRQKLEQTFGPEYGILAQLLREVRPTVKAKIPPAARSALWGEMLNSSALPLLRVGQVAEARLLLQEIILKATGSAKGDLSP